MPTTAYKLAWFLLAALLLLSCNTKRTVSATESTQTEASQLRHLEGTLITTTVECLADIDTSGISPRYIPRLYTPAKLTVQQQRVSLADTTATSTNSNTVYYNSQQHVRNLSPRFEPFRITASSFIIVVIALLLILICLGYKRSQ